MHKDFLHQLETGKIRSAQKNGDNWDVNVEIKQKILDIFRTTKVVNMDGFRDKEPLIPRIFSEEEEVRMVPGGSSVRPGSYIGRHVVIMPPSFINIGAFIDDFTMIDSHVLVGSCAQIGKNVHLSAAVQIGGVLEPVGSRPVIVEDNCFIGAGSILTEGVLVRKGAIIAPMVSLSNSVPIYDVVNEKIYKAEIPENAVVVPGTRVIKTSGWAGKEGLSISCAIIVKYRDEKTDKAVILEELLRN